MRILFSGVPAFGHLMPLAPLIRAAVGEGHDVALLTSGGMAPVIAAELPGVPVLPAGPMPDVATEHLLQRLNLSVDPHAGERPDLIGEFFGGTRVDLSIEAALERAQAWSPHVVLADAYDYVGPLVADTIGIDWHQVAIGPKHSELSDAADEVVKTRYSGRNVRPTAPRYYLDPCPPVLQSPGRRLPTLTRSMLVRPEAYRRPGMMAAPAPAALTAGRTHRVLVTFGTIYSDPVLVQGIVDSLDLNTVEVVATLGNEPRVERPADTDGIRYVTFVPLNDLLRGIDVVVAAAGSGTVLAALSKGIPMVLFPQGTDQPLNAARAEAAGVAIVVHQASDIGPAVSRILTEGSWANAARTAADQITQMSSPAEALNAIVRLAGESDIAAATGDRANR